MPALNTKGLFFLPVLLTLVTLSIFNTFIYLNREAEVYIVEDTNEQLVFWEETLRQNPTYRDAYLVLAELKRKLGDEANSQRLTAEAQRVDPYFVLGASVEN